MDDSPKLPPIGLRIGTIDKVMPKSGERSNYLMLTFKDSPIHVFLSGLEFMRVADLAGHERDGTWDFLIGRTVTLHTRHMTNDGMTFATHRIVKFEGGE